MILIGGVERTVDTSTWSQLAQSIYEQKRNSPITYSYNSVEHLNFEMKLRSNIVEAAKGLNESGVRFTTFKNARCNEQFWNLTAEGGFRLKEGITPAAGIRDIFVNGRMYGFECATAVVIVLYRGVLDSIQETEFNRIFANLLLYDWHYDSDLRLIQEQGSEHAYPGDVLYFKNPEFNPETPQWRGENAVKVADNLYYGHGIGIRSKEGILFTLNRFRLPFSTTSAYLTDQVIHPDFLYISKFASGAAITSVSADEQISTRSPYIYARIGGQRFIRDQLFSA
ncbi:protein-glutamine gamma-glutamyltransferase [Paenibacillus sediminis]|uniref:Protein-glutamine gamma-glutamyltransferase n=1 Tax=Paenibacillus sediminis TaxID=664909 RepID=A0ABS4H0W3_9BACL|nr:protein-glutamine gamma-glutamyltransferase [Paenibacillus sediminis]MBP1936165.1 protein-glutamine gamma-glutamyltransferase [Paenibacillus sediminis]